MKADHAELVKRFLSIEEIQPGRCEDEIFTNGQFFCCLAGPHSWLIEAWVQEIRKLSGARVDWSFAGGRAGVSFLGNEEELKRLIEAAKLTRPALEEAARAQQSEMMKSYPAVQWLNADNPFGAEVNV